MIGLVPTTNAGRQSHLGVDAQLPFGLREQWTADSPRLPPANSLIQPLPHLSRAAVIVPAPRLPVPYDSLEALADQLALLLQGRGYDLLAGCAGFAHTDTFAKVTVFARGLTPADAKWIGAAILLSPGGRFEDLDRLQVALDAAIARRG